MQFGWQMEKSPTDGVRGLRPRFDLPRDEALGVRVDVRLRNVERVPSMRDPQHDGDRKPVQTSRRVEMRGESADVRHDGETARVTTSIDC